MIYSWYNTVFIYINVLLPCMSLNGYITLTTLEVKIMLWSTAVQLNHTILVYMNWFKLRSVMWYKKDIVIENVCKYFTFFRMKKWKLNICGTLPISTCDIRLRKKHFILKILLNYWSWLNCKNNFFIKV